MIAVILAGLLIFSRGVIHLRINLADVIPNTLLQVVVVIDVDKYVLDLGMSSRTLLIS